MKKLLIGLGIVLLGLVLFRIALLPSLVERAFERQVTQNFERVAKAEIEDGLHVFVCGAGSPLYDPQRGAPCLGVVAGDRAFLFDVGAGSVGRLGPMGFPTDRLDGIYLTHLHSDHIGGLGDALMLGWVNNARTEPMTVTGPIGTAQVVDGFNTAYALDSGYRTAHHGEAIAPPSGAGGVAQEIDVNGQTVIFDRDGIVITAVQVSHEPISPALGYRIDYQGRSVSISGDTVADADFQTLSEGVDVMLHEALNAEMVTLMKDGAEAAGLDRLATIFEDIKDYHATPVDAARVAEAADADALILYHIVPMLPNDRLIPMFVDGVEDAYSGPVTVAKDGLVVRLPSGSDAIDYSGG